MARDILVNEITDLEGSTRLMSLERQFGKPKTWQKNYGRSDTLAALRLVLFLYGPATEYKSQSQPRPNRRMRLSSTKTSWLWVLRHHFGIYQSDIDRLSYKLAPHEAYVIDRRLPPGSPPQFQMQVESASRTVIPGLVALLPRGSSGSRV